MRAVSQRAAPVGALTERPPRFIAYVGEGLAPPAVFPLPKDSGGASPSPTLFFSVHRTPRRARCPHRAATRRAFQYRCDYEERSKPCGRFYNRPYSPRSSCRPKTKRRTAHRIPSHSRISKRLHWKGLPLPLLYTGTAFVPRPSAAFSSLPRKNRIGSNDPILF